MEGPPQDYNSNQDVLAAAIHCGMFPLARTLIDEGSPGGTSYFCNHLHIAVRMDNIDLVVLLLEKGYGSLAPEDARQAAMHGKMAMVEFILDRIKDNVEEEYQFYYHAFGGAAFGGHLEVLRVSLEKAASRMLARNNDRQTSDFQCHSFSMMDNLMFTASVYGHLEMLKFILGHVGFPGPQTAKHKRAMTVSALTLAARRGYLDVVLVLLDEIPVESLTPMWLQGTMYAAAKGGWREVLEILLDRVARLDHPPKTMQRCLLGPVKSGQVETVELLLDWYFAASKQPESDYTRKFYHTAFVWAESNEYTSITSLLVSYGLDSPPPVK